MRGASWRWRYTKKLLSAAGGYLFNQIKTPKGRKQRRRRRVCCARVHTWVGLGLVPPLRALDERTDGRMHRIPPLLPSARCPRRLPFPGFSFLPLSLTSSSSSSIRQARNEGVPGTAGTR